MARGGETVNGNGDDKTVGANPMHIYVLLTTKHTHDDVGGGHTESYGKA